MTGGGWQQLELFGPRVGLTRRSHPDTSRAAAARVMPATGTQRRRVLDHVTLCGVEGATDLELQTALQLGGNSERPRRIELVDAGLIVDSGTRRDDHIVWVLAPVET